MISNVSLLDRVSRVGKNFLFLFVTNAASLLSSVLLYALLARYWGTTEFGKFSFVFAFVGLFVFLSDFGLNQLLVREVARDKDKVSAYVNNSLGLVVIASIVCWIAICLGINSLSETEETIWAVYLAGGYVVIGGYVLVFRGAFYAYEKMEYETITLFVEKLVVLLLSWILLVLGKKLMAIALVFVVGRFVNLLFSILLYTKFVQVDWSVSFDRKIWRTLFTLTIPFGINILLTAVYIQVDVVLLSIMTTDRDAGLYRAATALIIPLTVVATSLNNALFPVLSRLHDTAADSLHHTAEKSVKYLFILGLGIALGILALADKFILIVYSQEYTGSISVLRVLALIVPLRFVNNSLAVTLTSVNKQRLRTLVIACAALVNVAANMILIPSLGYMGAGYATLVTESVITALLYCAIANKLGAFHIRQLWFKPTLAGMIMFLVLMLVHRISVFLLIPLGALVYLGSLYLMKGFSSTEINLLRELVSKNYQRLLRIGWKPS
jgi:O-antigen/teichoic acid export membrane protein